MNNLVETPKYCTRTDYGMYKVLLCDNGYGDMRLTTVSNGNAKQLAFFLTSSDVSLFRPGMGYVKDVDNDICISGLVRILCSARFGIEEDVPNPWTLPPQFDTFALWNAVATKYGLDYEYVPKECYENITHKIFVRNYKGLPVKVFSAGCPDMYSGKKYSC